MQLFIHDSIITLVSILIGLMNEIAETLNIVKIKIHALEINTLQLNIKRMAILFREAVNIEV